MVTATHLHVYTVLVFAVLPVAYALARQRHWRTFILYSGIAALACAPFLVKAISQSGQLGGLTPIEWASIASLPRAVWFPWPTWGGKYMVGGAWLLLIGTLAVLTRATTLRRWSARTSLGVSGTTALILGWLLAPLAVILAWSAVGSDLYAPRYMIITSPALALAMGVGLYSLRKPMLAWVVLGIALLTFLTLPFSAQRTLTGKGAQSALIARSVEAEMRAGDAVLFAGAGGRTTQPRNVKYAFPAPFGEAVDLTLGVPYHETDWLYDVDVPLKEGVCCTIG